MKINLAGYLQDVIQIPSANFDERPSGTAIRLLVIHNISLPPNDFSGNALIELFTNQLDDRAHPYYAGLRDLKVSSHFLIRRQGEIIQFVSCAKRADALAALLKVDAADKAAFVSLAKARHAEIFASVESADSIAARLKAALQSDARLAKYAEAV